MTTGLQAKYASLFSLMIKQPFYLNGLYTDRAIAPEPDFEIVPTPQCLETMKRLDYVFRPAKPRGGATVMARVMGVNGSGHDLLRFKPRAGDKLNFYLVMRNNAAMSYNNLPVAASPGRFYYFNNLVGDGAAPRTGLHLSLAATGVDPVNDATRENKTAYSYTHPAIIAPGVAFVKHLATGRQIEPVSLTNDGTNSYLSFNLQSLPEGKCQLHIGVLKDEFYFNGSALPSGAWGVIEIFLSNTIAPHYQVAEADYSLLPDRPVYDLLFENRAVTWRYRVQLSEQSALYKEIDAIAVPATKAAFINAINIVTNDGALSFTQTPVAANPTPTLLEFVSNAPVRFKEKYLSSTVINKPLKLDLNKNIGLGPPPAPTVKANLPHPAPLLINAATPPDIYSEIFITI
jgi:hypothetical protein